MKDNKIGLLDGTGKPISPLRKLADHEKAYPMESCPKKSILPTNKVFIVDSPVFASNFCNPGSGGGSLVSTCYEMKTQDDCIKK